jgi:hypothetical protein
MDPKVHVSNAALLTSVPSAELSLVLQVLGPRVQCLPLPNGCTHRPLLILNKNGRLERTKNLLLAVLTAETSKRPSLPYESQIAALEAHLQRQSVSSKVASSSSSRHYLCEARHGPKASEQIFVSSVSDSQTSQ